MAFKAKANQKFRKVIYSLAAIIFLLILTLIAIFVTYYSDTDAINTKKGVHVNLGSLNYDFSSGKVVKRDDPNLSSLKSFLVSTAEKDISLGCSDSHYGVLLASKDENQVLLAYGCDYPSAKMFAVKSGDNWRLISPSNQFDLLGVPLCSHVDQNNIEKSIAPVCYNESEDVNNPVTYTVR